LDAAGRAEDATQSLGQALKEGTPPPALARQASLLLAKRGRYRESLELLGRAIESAPAQGELQLTEAIVVALTGDMAAAAERLKRIEARWPEWDRPWLVHGLLLNEMGRRKEATSKFRAASALGSREDLSSCASLRTWVFDTCGK